MAPRADGDAKRLMKQFGEARRQADVDAAAIRAAARADAARRLESAEAERRAILTDARYSDWKAYDNVPFPKHIEINRPKDEYAVVIDVVKMDINKGVTQEKFALAQPEGSTLQVVGQAPVPGPAPPTPAAKGRVPKK